MPFPTGEGGLEEVRRRERSASVVGEVVGRFSNFKSTSTRKRGVEKRRNSHKKKEMEEKGHKAREVQNPFPFHLTYAKTEQEVRGISLNQERLLRTRLMTPQAKVSGSYRLPGREFLGKVEPFPLFEGSP